MARAKKQKLSLEELLEQTLLKEDEYPYKVPSNWIWCNVSNFFENLTSGTKKIQQKSYTTEGDFAIIDQGKELIGGYTSNSELVFDGELPVIIFGDHTRVIKYIDFPFVQGADGVKVLKPLKHVNEKFFYYLLQNLDIPDLGYRRHFKLLSSLNSPFPPLTEQQRIVETIESLFEKLDTAKELVQDALESFEKRKAAILHKAFTGELTAKWREENKVNLDTWEEKKLKEICTISSGGTPSRKTPEYYTGNIPWIKTGEIRWNYIYDAEEKITQEAIDNSSAKLVEKGAVLVAMYGQGLTRGRAAILDTVAATNQAVCVLKVNENSFNKFIYYYFMYNYWKFREEAVGGNQPNLSGKIISDFTIKLPLLEEQREIVTIIDFLLEKEQQAQELCDIIEKINLMKKAILVRAFSGELGTNNPEEESAIELLKEVLKEKL